MTVDRPTGLLALCLCCCLLLAGAYGVQRMIYTDSPEEPEMATWYEGDTRVAASIDDIAAAVQSPSTFYLGVVARMPGLSEVTLVEEAEDKLVIKTSEGLMTRTHLTRELDEGRVLVEYDERYDAGSLVTATSHFREEYVAEGSEVHLTLTISDVTAPGVLGFIYRHLASRNIGSALLEATRDELQATSE